MSERTTIIETYESDLSVITELGAVALGELAADSLPGTFDSYIES